MSQPTRRAIVDATVRLAEKKALNKITVRDIVEACGITRNTFYYYFHDIYDVLEDAVNLAFERLRDSWTEVGEKNLFDLIDFCMRYKKVWLNLYRTVGHEQLGGFVSKRLHGILLERLRVCAVGLDVDEEDMLLLCTFFEEALTGCMLRWLRENKEVPIEQAHVRMLHARDIFEGQIRHALENCARKKLERMDRAELTDTVSGKEGCS